MNIEELRGEFLIFGVIQEQAKRENLQQLITSAGYNVQLFAQYDLLDSAVAQDIPHIVICDLPGIQNDLKTFVERMHSFSPEILLILIGSESDFPEVKKFFLFGLYDFFLEFPNGEAKIICSLDRACERLYYQYQNEQLFEELRNRPASNQQFASLTGSTTIESEDDLMAVAQGVLDGPNDQDFFSSNVLLDFLEKIGNSEDETKLFDLFLETVYTESNYAIKGIFFRYYPQQLSLVAKQMIGAEIDPKQGLGFKIATDTLSNVPTILNKIQHYKLLKDLMVAIGAPEFIAFNLAEKNQVEGIFVFGASDKSVITPDAEFFFAALKLAFAKLQAEKHLQQIDLIDPISHIYNSRAFTQFLHQEIARARRLELAVSLVRFDIDDIVSLSNQIGPGNIDIMIKSIAIIVKKSSRINDIVARIEHNRFAIIMPHTSQKGALIRVERLRKMIESATFNFGSEANFKVTIGMGLSEYPSLARDSEDLLESAELALGDVVARGGNKVGVAVVPDGFQPDFIVKDV